MGFHGVLPSFTEFLEDLIGPGNQLYQVLLDKTRTTTRMYHSIKT